MGAGTEGEWPERKDPSVKHWGRSFAAEPRITAEMIAAMPQLPRQRQQLRPVTELGPLAGLPERPPYYAPPPLFTIRSADDFTPNPYLIGVPHGEGVVTFADGSTYEGQMHNGYPHGYGMYKGIDGEVHATLGCCSAVDVGRPQTKQGGSHACLWLWTDQERDVSAWCVAGYGDTHAA